ncbi:hypothetical protein NL676_022369 [Syzygium grande]|nr:hypothetical protein NL676_022369 [Syzygium grande]
MIGSALALAHGYAAEAYDCIGRVRAPWQVKLLEEALNSAFEFKSCPYDTQFLEYNEFLKSELWHELGFEFWFQHSSNKSGNRIEELEFPLTTSLSFQRLEC